MTPRTKLCALLITGLVALGGCAYDMPQTPEAQQLVLAQRPSPSPQVSLAFPTGSIDTVLAAEAQGVFSLVTQASGDQLFTNYAGGYQVCVPAGFVVADMGDASYRSTLENGPSRLEIYTQDLGAVTAEEYMNYSNRFLENTFDFTVTLDNRTTSDAGAAIHTLMYDRHALATIPDDRNHYALADIIMGSQCYSFLLTSSEPIDSTVLDALVASFEAFAPAVAGQDVQRTAKSLSDKTAETVQAYNTLFGEEAGLTWGIFEPSLSRNKLHPLRLVENKLQHHFDIVLCYSNVKDEAEADRVYDTLENLWAHGAICELTLQTTLYNASGEGNAVYEILDGEHDDFLRAYARAVSQFGHPVLFRPFNEMNGDWCNYSAYWTARDASTYVALWRYVYQIFEEEGANKNTLWVWNPNERSYPNFAWNAADNYYPGDGYVDIIGLTGYNTGTYYEGEVWRSFDEIYTPLYEATIAQYQQPLMITEFACSDYGGDKAAWVEDMFSQLEQYPRIKAAVWWDSADRDTQHNIARSYFIDNNQRALRIFQKHLAQEDYVPDSNVLRYKLLRDLP